MGFHRGAFLLYLNGISVPCPMINVSAGVGVIPEATFALAPHPLLQRLGADDRVEVVAFYRDDTLNPSNPQWCLIFEGEILGWSYANTPMGTQMNFSALADISIFTKLKYSFITAGDVMAHALDPAGGLTATQPGAFFPFSLFKKGLLYGKNGANQATMPDIRKPFEILFNAVRGMMDKQLHKESPGTPPAIPLVNFFARWARKRNFQNRFTALPLFEDDDGAAVFPIMDAVQSAQVLNNLAGSAATGDQGSMWGVLQNVFTQMYFEVAMLPTPPAYRVRLSDGYIHGFDQSVDVAAEAQMSTPMRLMNYFVKPQMLFGVPPACNVLFSSMVKTLEYSEDYSAQPTRYYVNEQMVTNMLKDDAFAAATLTFGYPEVVAAAMKVRTGGVGVAKNAMASGKDVLVYPEEFYKGPVVASSAVPPWFTLLMTKHADNKKKEATSSTAAPDILTMFDTYVRYEYYRERYAARRGQATLEWNPYVVPGFPCFIFERRAAGLDVVGYIQSVTWNMSLTGMSTNISYGYGRTMQEFLQTQYDESKNFGILGAGPAEPLPTVRNIIQDPVKAEEFYKGLFHGRGTVSQSAHASDAGKPAAGLLHTLVGVRDGDGVSSIELKKGDGSPAATPHIPKIDGIPDFNIMLDPLPEKVEEFAEYDAALRYNARPICTMREYIRFRTGQYPDKDPDVSAAEKGAAYYSRLYQLRQGPAKVAPTPAMTGAAVDPGQPVGSSGTSATATAYTKPKEALPVDFPQTRIDWDRIILAYKAALAQMPPLE